MAALDEEREAVSGFYVEAFEEDFGLGGPIWRISLKEGAITVTVIFRFPAGYPDKASPALALEFEPWPSGGGVLAERLRGEVLELWEPGEGCVIAWAEHIRQALLDEPPELADAAGAAAAAGAVAAAAAASADVAAEDALASANQAVAAVPLAAAMAEPLCTALVAAGFARCGEQLFSHGSGVTVEVAEQLTITVDGVDAEDLHDRASLQLEDGVDRFGASLLQYVAAERNAEAPGFAEDADEAAGEDGDDFLPTAEELKVQQKRPMLIYTWGKALRNAAPADSQCNFNAGILNGRGGGADLRTMNGLSEEVQNNVKSCGLFPRWISMVCHKVEHSDLHTISINCTKGRHRSVAAAMILKQRYYPEASVVHLTIR